MSSEKKRVVILGSGFGGIHAALELKKLRKRNPKVNLEVVIISNVDYFWLVTMAHEVATGNLIPSDIMQPVRSLSVEVYDDYIKGEVTNIDVARKRVHYRLVNRMDSDLAFNQEIQYDFLINAIGSEAFFFGTEGVAEYAFPLKTLDDTKNIKNHILNSFEEAQLLHDEEDIKKTLRFVIVGGGATGVELAGELADMINGPLKSRFKNVWRYAEIVIIHGGKHLVVENDDWFSGKVESLLLNRHGIKVQYGSYVTRVTKNGAWIHDQLIPSRTIIWTAGVVARNVDFSPSNSIEREEKTRRIIVQPTLNLSEAKEVFIIGDQAAVPNPEGGRYSMRAQFAVRQGQIAVRNIIRLLQNQPLIEFAYKDKGFIVSLGNGDAVARVFGLRLTGFFAWLLYRTAYLPQIVGWRARIRTVGEWTLNLFLSRDLSEI